MHLQITQGSVTGDTDFIIYIHATQKYFTSLSKQGPVRNGFNSPHCGLVMQNVATTSYINWVQNVYIL